MLVDNRGLVERLVKKYLNKEGLEVGEVFKYIERTRVQLRPPLLHFLLGQTHRMRLLKMGTKPLSVRAV